MRSIALLLCLWHVLPAQTPPAARPQYVQSSIVNAANPAVAVLAPNTLATIYGKGLAWAEKALSKQDIQAGMLPVALPGAGVRVIIDGLAAPLLYVSPGQVNFLVPSELRAGQAKLRVMLDGHSGDAVQVALADAAPALFQADPEFVVAARPGDGSVITPKAPAKPGEIIVLYATGLGRTKPPVETGEIARTAAPLERVSDFQVTLDQVPVPREDILYAGVAPGFAGLFQINLRLPQALPRNPEIRIGFSNGRSPSGVRLPTAN